MYLFKDIFLSRIFKSGFIFTPFVLLLLAIERQIKVKAGIPFLPVCWLDYFFRIWEREVNIFLVNLNYLVLLRVRSVIFVFHYNPPWKLPKVSVNHSDDDDWCCCFFLLLSVPSGQILCWRNSWSSTYLIQGLEVREHSSRILSPLYINWQRKDTEGRRKSTGLQVKVFSGQ